MSLIEIGIILFLFVIAVIVPHNYGYDKGFSDGQLDGAESMWNDLTQAKDDRINKYDNIRD